MLRYRIRASHLVPFTALALAIAAGCSNGSTNDDDDELVAAPQSDDGKKTSTGTPIEAGTKPTPIETTDRDAETTPDPTGCALYPNADFCDDFDRADALTAGKTKWDFIEPTDQPVATLTADRAVSAPSSLLSRIIDGTTPGAKFAKTITKSNFTKAVWDYDVYIASPGRNDGYFLDDFQFTDATGPDTFGFRIVLFAKDGAIDFARVEHNGDAAKKGDYFLGDSLPDGTLALGKWMHFTQTVKFDFSTDAGANKVTYTLAVDGAQAWTHDFVGLARAQAAFARIAGLAFVFDKAKSAGLEINWDNQALVLE